MEPPLALLVTDDVRRSRDVAVALETVAPCRVVHVAEPWQGIGPLHGVVADVDIRHPPSAQALRVFTLKHGRTGPPLIYLLRGAPGAMAETKALLAALGPVAPEHYAAAGADAFARCAVGEAKEGIAAFKEKRPPAWETAPP